MYNFVKRFVNLIIHKFEFLMVTGSHFGKAHISSSLTVMVKFNFLYKKNYRTLHCIKTDKFF